MLSNITQKTPSDAAVAWVAEPYAGPAAKQHMSAPISTTQGTALSAAGFVTGRTAVVITDLPGSHPPREAPV